MNLVRILKFIWPKRNKRSAFSHYFEEARTLYHTIVLRSYTWLLGALLLSEKFQKSSAKIFVSHLTSCCVTGLVWRLDGDKTKFLKFESLTIVVRCWWSATLPRSGLVRNTKRQYNNTGSPARLGQFRGCATWVVIFRTKPRSCSCRALAIKLWRHFVYFGDSVLAEQLVALGPASVCCSISNRSRKFWLMEALGILPKFSSTARVITLWYDTP